MTPLRAATRRAAAMAGNAFVLPLAGTLGAAGGAAVVVGTEGCVGGGLLTGGWLTGLLTGGALGA